MKDRIGEHKGYVRNKKLKEPTGKHFNQHGHSITDLKVTILEQIKKKDTLYRKERESYFIRKLNTFYGGLNKSP